tara:strand:- start:138 stop:416 length:279 start_codon:yes stop_codon:yes gene_type:complete
MPLNKNKKLAPWDYELGDSKYQEEPWILKKGKEYITIRKNTHNRGNFYLQKDEERVLSLGSLQTRLTYHQLIEYGYKLQKPKKKTKTKIDMD